MSGPAAWPGGENFSVQAAKQLKDEIGLFC
jgi:hypothetical protein